MILPRLKFTARELERGLAEPGNPKHFEIVFDYLGATIDQLRAAMGANEQQTLRSLEKWRVWTPSIRDANPVDVDQMQSIYNTTVITPDVFEALCSDDPDIAQKAANRVRKGGPIHADSVLPPESNIAAYLPPRGKCKVLSAPTDNGGQQIHGLITMQTHPDDVESVLRELGYAAEKRYDSVGDLPDHIEHLQWMKTQKELVRRVFAAAKERKVAHAGVMVVRPSEGATGQAKALAQTMLRSLEDEGIEFTVCEIFVLRKVRRKELKPPLHNIASEIVQLQNGLGERVAVLEETITCGTIPLDIEWGIWVTEVSHAVER